MSGSPSPRVDELLAPLVACRDCRLMRYPRLAPACTEHLPALIEAIRSFDGTPKDLDDHIDALVARARDNPKEGTMPCQTLPLRSHPPPRAGADPL